MQAGVHSLVSSRNHDNNRRKKMKVCLASSSSAGLLGYYPRTEKMWSDIPRKLESISWHHKEKPRSMFTIFLAGDSIIDRHYKFTRYLYGTTAEKI